MRICMQEYHEQRHIQQATSAYTRSAFSKSVVVFVSMSTLWCTELVFIEPGTKMACITVMSYSYTRSESSDSHE